MRLSSSSTELRAKCGHSDGVWTIGPNSTGIGQVKKQGGEGTDGNDNRQAKTIMPSTVNVPSCVDEWEGSMTLASSSLQQQVQQETVHDAEVEWGPLSKNDPNLSKFQVTAYATDKKAQVTETEHAAMSSEYQW